MSKSFKFKLDALLRVQKLKEQKAKMELGKILQEIEKENYEIESLNNNIEEIYKSQEQLLDNNTKGNMLSAFSRFIGVARKNIENHKQCISALKNKYDEKVKKINTILGEVKILNNLRDRHKEEYKILLNRKEEEDIEDIINMRRANG